MYFSFNFVPTYTFCISAWCQTLPGGSPAPNLLIKVFSKSKASVPSPGALVVFQTHFRRVWLFSCLFSCMPCLLRLCFPNLKSWAKKCGQNFYVCFLLFMRELRRWRKNWKKGSSAARRTHPRTTIQTKHFSTNRFVMSCGRARKCCCTNTTRHCMTKRESEVMIEIDNGYKRCR